MGKILVTGGTGYLGTHMLVELVKQGYEPLCVDNLHNSNPSVLLAVKEICGKEIPFIKADAGDVAAMRALFAEHRIDAVIHFAGHKAVGESVAHPLMYYRNNYDSALTILEMCLKHGSALVFSSSATVYGVPHFLPLTEDHPLSAVNPYGRTKLYIEETIRDVALAHPEFNVSILRYFNPVGAHESGLIGENPNGIPNNLMPFVCQTAAGIRKELHVFGDDYDTPDGTCLRDYIDVVDLAKAHVAAVDRMTQRRMKEAYEIFNIGTGTPVSVLELVKGFERANGLTLNYKIVGRRAGDVKAVWADTQRANKELGWKAERPLEETLRSAWAWEKHVRGMN